MRALLATSLALLLACQAPLERRAPVQLQAPLDHLGMALVRLIEGAPPARPLGVSLVTIDLPDEEGIMGTAQDLGGDMWVITIDSSLCPPLQRMVLTHEWAHVLAGDGGCALEGSHGPTFGVAWAAAWRAAVGEAH